MEGSHLNWTDAIVAAIIIGCALSGLIHGFVDSVFRITSFFLSAYLAITFIKPVSDFIMKTAIYTNIKSSIMKGLLRQSDAVAAASGNSIGTGTGIGSGSGTGTGQVTGTEFIDRIPLPGMLKDKLEGGFSNLSGLFDVSTIADKVSTNLTGIVISIIAFIILFIAIRLLFSLVRLLLKGVTKLPVIKQVDKTGGFVLGFVEGILVVFVLMAVLALLSTTISYSPIYGVVDDSLIARFFYENNFIINKLFGK